MEENHSVQNSKERRFLTVSAWVSMLLVSDLPDILWKTFFGQVPEWLAWIKVGLLAMFAGLFLIWKALRPLRQYALVFLVFYTALRGSAWLGDTSLWQSRFGGSQVSFTLGYVGIYIRDFGVALTVIAVLWIVKRKRSQFFFAVD